MGRLNGPIVLPYSIQRVRSGQEHLLPLAYDCYFFVEWAHEVIMAASLHYLHLSSLPFQDPDSAFYKIDIGSCDAEEVEASAMVNHNCC